MLNDAADKPGRKACIVPITATIFRLFTDSGQWRLLGLHFQFRAAGWTRPGGSTAEELRPTGAGDPGVTRTVSHRSMRASAAIAGTARHVAAVFHPAALVFPAAIAVGHQ